MLIPATTSGRSRAVIVVIALAILFLALRLPGLGLPYHQDEWKNVSSSATVEGAGQFFAHPPLMQILFVADYRVFGQDGFRILPLLFSVGSAALLYFVVKKRSNKAAAVWSVVLFSICFYNALGSLQTDVDGSILPFFFLLAVYFYDKWTTTTKKTWFIPLAAACLLGFLVKLSFILVIGALFIDWFWNNRRSLTVKRSAIALASLVGFGALYIALLYLIQAVYPAFSIHLMLSHANQFADAGRDWTQIFVQGIKALYYLSPFLILPLLFTSKEIFKKTRIFWLYLILGIVFYFVLFDFSRAALDKYLMFAIVPLAAIVAGILAGPFKSRPVASYKTPIIIGTIIALTLLTLNFLPQSVAALYPKTEWFGRVLHGHWNVLTPLMGGSGPMGFYVSFLFIALSYIASAALAILGLFKKEWQTGILIVLLMIGVAYNGVFAEELLFGKINGSAPEVLAKAVAFIDQDPSIKQVLTYNDTGAELLSQSGKYAGRIYATPGAEEGYRAKFAAFDGDYMVIDIPHLYESGFYGRFFAKCRTLYEARSGAIDGRVYDCSAAKAMIDKI